MNNHKSVSGKIPISPDDCVAGILVKDFQKLRRWMAENNLNEAIPDAYRKGIQEGRRLEAERIEKIVDSFKCSKCEVSYDGHCPCQRDKRKMLVAIQSRNEGSEQ